MADESLRILEHTAFCFPGQGSQAVGMAGAFDEAWPETREVFARLDDAVEIDLRGLRFEGSAEALQKPRNTQPVLLATGLAVHAGVRDRFGVAPELVAGHSLGHFTALAVAGAMDPEATVALTHRRGQCMEEAAARDGPGTMVAVLLAEPEIVTEECGTREDVGVALYNGPNQTVISGTTEGVTAVQDRLAERTTARFRELDVGTAFHSPVMASAVACVEDAMEAVQITEAEIPVVSDVSGEIYTDPSVARQDLTAQITSPVDWVRVVERLREAGISRVVEFPPAGVLSPLVERIAPEIDTHTLETPADAETVFS